MPSLTSGRVTSDDRRSDISGGSTASTLIRDSIISTKSGNSQVRKFTASVGRPGLAREVREAVRSAISAQNTSRRAFTADPLDYEKFVSENATLLENDPQRELLMFPRDDIEELVETVPSRTVIPMITEKDIAESTWSLTRDALRNYIRSKHSIVFNYAKFSGDYINLNEESMEIDGVLSSLVFESDMVSEEERTASETFCSDIIKEGYVMVLRTDSGLFDNFKSAKRRYCTVKRLSNGEIAVDIRKSRECFPERPHIVLHSAQLRSARKGRTVLEVKPAPTTEKDKTDMRALTLGFENDDDLSSWFHSLQREIAFLRRGGDDEMSLKSGHPDAVEATPSETDSASMTSLDSDRGPLTFRGPRAVARALQPPVVDRKNLFSLYRNLSPLPELASEPSCMLTADSRNRLPDCPSQNSTYRYLVVFSKLDLKLDIAPGVSRQIEPFYVSIFAFDLSEGKRVSEEFHMECSDMGDGVVEAPKDDLAKTFGVSRMQLTCRTANQMILTTSSSSKNLWIVCRIDRMLSLDCSGDLYMKSTCDIKAVAKLQKLIQSSQSRLFEYRQRFAWAASYFDAKTVGLLTRTFKDISVISQSDEIKIKLPICLRASDHLLFSFSHISVGGQPNTKLSESVENPIGHAWLPLIWKKDRFVMESDEQEFALPVAAELPDSYFRIRPLQEGNSKENLDIKWVDQRPLFRFRLRLVSAVFTSEPLLQDFLQACDRLECGNHVRDMVASEALTTVDIKRIIPFLHVILSRLFELITSAPTEKLALFALKTLLFICDTCQEGGHKRLLRDFVRDHFVTLQSREESTHTALCRLLPIMIHSFQNDSNGLAMFVRQSWFFLDVIAKSIAQTIFRRSLLKCPRKDRLALDVLEQIGGFIGTVVSLLISKHRELPKESRTGVTCVAFFLRCCLSFIDRGVVFKWINSTLQRLDDCESKVMREYKLDILTIIAQHEHWLPLCLPVLIDSRNQVQRVSNRSMNSDYCESTVVGSRFLPRIFNQVFQSPIISNDKQGYLGCLEECFHNPTYISHHFPSGLLSQELYACIRERREFCRRAIVLLRNLLAKHSYDKWYLDMNIQRRIAMLYVSVVRFAMDYIVELEDSMLTASGDTSALGLGLENIITEFTRGLVNLHFVY
ncbi:hypothetical protein KIN20_019531 [Parelaphostrongylus tenuis]|uniref:PH domain-containing protein n=1 Tax=Parelaphostrongylus tenuis TaxID=148309 RepID=A0AAD5QSG9_PARTN|nr:hypothetical protein KIN20_019531 [Parelaphostrongylus tenuis]